ncbi:unnamed protein product [Brachionus calyciflorus]|uniref:Uncharacterized protein n=1 Tax=Brachionus calyciflorus TaxID=104777 RepID=A0A814MA92_9BILA|nr:unnamed protein product [Brachionus calyciflorus]
MKKKSNTRYRDIKILIRSYLEIICFHIRGYETQDGYYKTDLFGKLVITNFFICEDVQKKLSMNNPRSKKLHELKPMVNKTLFIYLFIY